MISYNELYEALRKEKYSDELQVLDKNFLSNVSEYFEEKRKVSDKKNDVFSDVLIKSKKKFENAMVIFKELMTRRRKKILNLAFVASETGISKKDFVNLLEFEKELFEDVLKNLEKADKNLNDGITFVANGNSPKTKLVRFKEQVDEFLDLNGETLGPFKIGEVANINNEIAEILVQDKKVEILEQD